jgi:hypothetical protein
MKFRSAGSVASAEDLRDFESIQTNDARWAS